MKQQFTDISLFINDITLPAGTERAVVNLANNLANHGFRVEIVSLYTRKGESFYPLNSGVALTHVGLRLHPSAILRFAVLVPSVVRLAMRRQLRTLIGTNHAVNTVLGISKMLKIKAKCIACEHVTYEEAPTYARGLRRRLYPKLDQVVVLTKADEATYRQWDQLTNITVIPNELSFWPAEPAKVEAKRMIAIGHLIERKGFDLLIDSLQDVLRSHPDWTLTIVGEGDMKSALKSQIARYGLEDQIHLVSPTKEIESLYSSSSLYLMSSRIEAFGMVLIEAEAYGLPIIAYDCPSGPREILTPEDGFLIPMGDCAAYAAAVGRLVSNSDLRRRMGGAARQNAARFRSEAIYEQWAVVLKDES